MLPVKIAPNKKATLTIDTFSPEYFASPAHTPNKVLFLDLYSCCINNI